MAAAVFERELRRGTPEPCLHRFQVRPGDCVFLPAGAVHALGQGLLAAEIQQASDTTFRLFDWNRLGADGKPRELHIEQGLAAIDYDLGPVAVQTPQATDRPEVVRLAACDKFILDRWRFDRSQKIGGDNRFHIVAVLTGEASVEGDAAARPLAACGQTILIPGRRGAKRPSRPAAAWSCWISTCPDGAVRWVGCRQERVGDGRVYVFEGIYVSYEQYMSYKTYTL